MSHDLTKEQAISVLSSAFKPLRCVAESKDHGNLVRFEVFDGDEPLLPAQDLVRQQVTSSNRLGPIITHSRSTLEQDGHVLAAWSFPNFD